MRFDFDYIIAGGGCAGLSLVHLWQHTSLHDRRVLILDKNEGLIKGKTWSFWTREPAHIPFPIHKSYHNMRVISPEREATGSIAPWTYVSIVSEDFSQVVHQVLDTNPRVVRKSAKILQMRDHPSGRGAEVVTDQGTYTAQWVFNSIPSIPETLHKHIWLNQHFLGWRIRTHRPVFDEQTATLMDFRLPQKDQVRFVYLLPFSEKEALVEFTVFSEGLLPKDQYKEALQGYLKEHDIEPYEVVSSEQGVIPMTDYVFPRKKGHFIVNIGTAGGFTKASTGYTFANIQREVQSLTAGLVNQGIPTLSPQSPTRFHFYDRLLLYLIQHHGGEMANIFGKMFSRNKLPAILKFLGEESKLWEEIPLAFADALDTLFESLVKVEHNCHTGFFISCVYI